jgi:hypothetical protein
VKCGLRVALGVAGGYFLGRTKKMKLALMLGGMAAGRSAGGPGELLGAGTKILSSSPELAKLTDIVRSRLLEAGKGAVVAVATRQVESLTDRVGKRVESLGEVGAPGRRKADRGKDDEAPATDEYPEDEYAEEEYAGSEPAEYEDTEPADEAPRDEEEPARERAETPRRRTRAPADKARAARTGKTSSATATLKRTAPGASGVGRTASKASAGRKPGRTTRTQRGDGDG